MLYFAYGSNLNMLQMKKRCADSIPVARVSLKDYKLVFNHFADIIESKGDIVQGAIYEVSENDIKNLDEYEEYPDLYTKINVTVEDYLGKRYEAFVYVMVKKDINKPEQPYYQIIVDGYQDWELAVTCLGKALEETKKIL